MCVYVFAHVVSPLAGRLYRKHGNMEYQTKQRKTISKDNKFAFSLCVRDGGMCEVHMETLFAAHTTLAVVHKDRTTSKVQKTPNLITYGNAMAKENDIKLLVQYTIGRLLPTY